MRLSVSWGVHRASRNEVELERLLPCLPVCPTVTKHEQFGASPSIAEMVLSFFSGLCIERNLKSGKASSTRKIENFVTALRSL